MKEKRTKTKKFRWTFALVGLIGIMLGAASYSYFIEPNWLEVNHFTYASSDIPSTFSGTKIGFLSDIHYENNISRLKPAVDKLIANNPDIMIVGGDLIDFSTEKLPECLNQLERLNPKFGIYAVLGNHDNDNEKRKEVLEAVRKTKIKLIENDSYWISSGSERIKIGGVGDLITGTQNIIKTVGDVSESDFVVLASHDPDYFENLTNDNVDMVLSGHTHGGQVGFGFWYPVVPSYHGAKYRSGRVDQGEKTIFVSKGVGTTLFPLRFLARPDIMIVEIVKN